MTVLAEPLAGAAFATFAVRGFIQSSDLHAEQQQYTQTKQLQPKPELFRIQTTLPCPFAISVPGAHHPPVPLIIGGFGLGSIGSGGLAERSHEQLSNRATTLVGQTLGANPGE